MADGATAGVVTSPGTSVHELVVRRVLSAYGVPESATITLLTHSENATFAVDDPSGGPRSVLRVHRPGYHSLPAILSELDWVSALRAEGVVSTAEVLPAVDGRRVVTVATPDGSVRHVVRFAWMSGQEPAGERLVDDFRALGAITATLHEHSRGWTPPPGFTRLRWDWNSSIGPHGHWGRWQDGLGVGATERVVLGRLADLLRTRLATFGEGADRFGLIHADMRLANLLVEPGVHGRPTVHVIDFDDCGFGWYLYDLGASLSFMEDDPRVPELMAAWSLGYREVAALGPAEEAELETFVLLRRLLLVAWIGSHAETDLARGLGADFTRRSCDLAEGFLSRRG